MGSILHLGNVCFSDDEGSATVTNEPVLRRVAKLLEVDIEAAKNALTTRTVSAGGDIISAQHTAQVADYGRVS